MRDFFVGQGLEGEIFLKECSFPGEGYIGGESGNGSKTGPDKATISLATVGKRVFPRNIPWGREVR